MKDIGQFSAMEGTCSGGVNILIEHVVGAVYALR